MPDWFVRNAGRAGDLAFVMFTGAGENTKAVASPMDAGH